MSKIDRLIQDAAEHCRIHGGKLTIKRKQVLASLIEGNKALSAYEVIDIYKERYAEDISAMSVYRILDFLESQELVHKLKLANKYIACAHISCEHKHETSQFLICNQCHEVKEVKINDATFNKIKEGAESAGFYLASPQLEINCICSNCHSKQAA